MIFALLTLLSALSLATVAGWFSIIGVMAIYAGSPIHALIMGIVVEGGKIVTTSWLYRNWKFSSWLLKGPLIIFTALLMLTTSIGVFGFLSKAHLQQGAATLDNIPKIERLDQQISREKEIIADNEKVIAQLDATINSYLGKDRADRSVVIRRAQAPQRKQLREEIDAANKRIDLLSEERLKLQSEVRAVELEVGPVRYIAELIYGSENSNTKTLESAVKIFTLLIVLSLDPLAVTLLIAANHTLVRLRNEKEKISEATKTVTDLQEPSSTIPEIRNTLGEKEYTMDENKREGSLPGQFSESKIAASEGEDTTSVVNQESSLRREISPEIMEKPLDEKEENSNKGVSSSINKILEKKTFVDAGVEAMDGKEKTGESFLVHKEVTWPKIPEKKINEEKDLLVEKFFPEIYKDAKLPSTVIVQPRLSMVSEEKFNGGGVEGKIGESTESKAKETPWAHQEEVLRELVGNKHFTPQAIDEDKKIDTQTPTNQVSQGEKAPGAETEKVYKEGSSLDQEVPGEVSKDLGVLPEKKIVPLSWIKEFK